jgi:hypothetical protein
MSEVLGWPGLAIPLEERAAVLEPKACLLAPPTFNLGWIDFGVPGTGPVTPVQIFFAQARKARTGI